MKYVINKQFGGFDLSQEALEFLVEKKGWKIVPQDKSKNMYHSDTLRLLDEGYKMYENTGNNVRWIGRLSTLESDRELSFRSNPDVIEAVETLGEKSFGKHATLVIKDVPYSPEDGKLEIHDYDGMETLQTIPERY